MTLIALGVHTCVDGSSPDILRLLGHEFIDQGLAWFWIGEVLEAQWILVVGGGKNSGIKVGRLVVKVAAFSSLVVVPDQANSIKVIEQLQIFLAG